MDTFDIKKIEKRLYQPKQQPSIINVPPMHYIAIEGKGNPNEEESSYQQALQVLYAICYTIKMSKKGNHQLDHYFDHVVAPLEGLWWMKGIDGVDYQRKEDFSWISMIAQPSFVTQEVFEWACNQVTLKNGLDTSNAKLITIEEGMCITCMHIGSYDEEPKTLEILKDFAKENNLAFDYETRKHHEIYLNDPRRTNPSKLKTIIRLPVKDIIWNI